MNWVTTVLIITGFYFITKKLSYGFLIQSVGCIIYCILNIDWAVTTTNFVFLVINIYGWFKWQQKRN